MTYADFVAFVEAGFSKDNPKRVACITNSGNYHAENRLDENHTTEMLVNYSIN